MARPLRQQMLSGFDDLADPAEQPASAIEGAEDPSQLGGRTAYVIDAYSLIYQVFHAMPDMTSPTGQAVGAVHGFVRDVLEIIEKKKPEYLFAAFDHPSEVFRVELYDQYKINREEMPDDLRPQIELIRRFLEALGVEAVDCPSYEADDVIATIAAEVERRGGSCVIVSNDKDCRQLITDKVKLYNIRKNLIFDEQMLWDDWGIRPDQVIDFQALVGDSVDNVPGVPLIGPKNARELLQKYDTLDAVLEHADEVSGKKRRENLIEGRDLALVSRKLVTLLNDVPIKIDWKAGRVGGVDREACLELCRGFGFRRLADRIAQLAVQDAPAKWNADYVLVETEQQLQTLLDDLAAQEIFAFDTETTSPNPRWAELVGYSFSWEEGKAYYVPVRAPADEPQFDPDATLERLRPLLENEHPQKTGQNIKYDQVVLRSHGVHLRGVRFDTMVADYLLASGERTHDLNDLSKRYLNHKTIKIKSLIGSGRGQKRMDKANVTDVAEYAGEDADVSWRLTGILRRRLEEEELSDLYQSLEIPLIEVLAEMEYHGIKVDGERLRSMSSRYGRLLADLEFEIHSMAGGSFNIESPRQLAQVLFENLGLPVLKRTKTGPSTDAEVLGQLALLHELPAKIIEFRQHAKLKGTYVDALPELIHPATGRVHTSFKQDVAATGRLSSQDPNLQNIPVRTSEGREIRSAFQAGEPGWLLLSADYSQIELRVLAHFCGDAALREAFAQGEDIHTRVASEVFGVGLDHVTPELRRRAKAVNFGVIYGQTPFGLAKSLGIEKEEAAQFIDAYFDRYQGVDQFVAKTLDQCRRNGYVKTILGRRRTVDGVRSNSRRGDSRFRTLPERIAVNTVIQGSAADLIKTAMVNIHRRLRRESLPARMLLQIHDELVFEVPSDQLSPLAKLVTQEMNSAASLSVPLVVDVKAGPNWAECEPWG